MAAEVDRADGRPDDALRRVDEALALRSTTGEFWYDGGLLRLRAVLLREAGELAKSEECLIAAMTIVDQQGACLFRPSIAAELARLSEDHDRSAEARRLLSRFPNAEAQAGPPERSQPRRSQRAARVGRKPRKTT
jgi:hypothetical protein